MLLCIFDNTDKVNGDFLDVCFIQLTLDMWNYLPLTSLEFGRLLQTTLSPRP